MMMLLALAWVLTSCKTASFTSSGEDEKKFVSDFIAFMYHDSGPKYQEMMNALSPEYIKVNKIDISDYKVNNYSVWGFSIVSYNAGEGLVIAKIWGENRRWVHELTFKLRREKGKLYLVPSAHSESYIDPWYSVRSYIKE